MVGACVCARAYRCADGGYSPRARQDTTTSPRVLLAAAIAAGASGIDVDLEPQADNCAGAPTGDASDAALYAGWLAATRAVLAPHGIRLTAWVPARA